jgi:hypothetical protein
VFEWQWSGTLKEGQGFEIRLWRDGEPPQGVHNAVEDNTNGKVVPLDNNTYRLEVNKLGVSAPVKNRCGEYNWTVLLVQVTPQYQPLGVQAAPGRFIFKSPECQDTGDGGGGGGG